FLLNVAQRGSAVFRGLAQFLGDDGRIFTALVVGAAIHFDRDVLVRGQERISTLARGIGMDSGRLKEARVDGDIVLRNFFGGIGRESIEQFVDQRAAAGALLIR